jgi:DNA replication protein DnaC
LTCERCRGTGFEIVEKDGREFAAKCACRQGAASGDAGDARLRACRIPPRYEHCNLGDFEPSNPSLRAALEKVISYCAGYPHLGQDEGLGLLLTGDNGVGKTHLAVAVLRELVASKGASGQFWDFHELIREIRNSYDTETRTTELQVLEPVVSTDLLVLDDLGAWKMTDWMVDTLFYILNCRYMEKRATLITTNFQDAPPQAAQKDAFRRSEFLVDRIGQRLRSRLQEMCLAINIQAPDRREGRQIAHRLAIGATPGPRDHKG